MHPIVCFTYQLNEKSSFLFKGWGSELPSPKREAELLEQLSATPDADFSAQSPLGPILTVLLNPHRAFVLWMAEEGDSGKHATDSEIHGLDEQKFTLANGQVDEFSAFDTVSRGAATQAVAHFLKTREASSRLTWKED